MSAMPATRDAPVLMDGWIYASRAMRRRCLSTPVDQAGVFETPGFREG